MENLTPMLQQYQKLKKEYPGYILFFRLGDFYEMFYEDAKKASKILDLVLTSRSAGKSGKAPMCGIPYHASEPYVAKLIKSGCRVAICEQMESPAESKGIVKRDIVRLITTGTFIDENSTDTRYIASVFVDKNKAGIAFIDSEGGTINTTEIEEKEKIGETLSKISLHECIFPESQKENISNLLSEQLLSAKDIELTEWEEWLFNLDIAKRNLCEHFGTENMAGFGIENKPLAIRSAGALLEYLKDMNRMPLLHISRISLYSDTSHLYISPAALYGLEIDKLVETLDNTSTAMGKRNLKHWIYNPSLDLGEIQRRQEGVKTLLANRETRKNIATELKDTGDTEKALSRISCGYAGTVKDILLLKNLLEKIPRIKNYLLDLKCKNPVFNMEELPELEEFLSNTVNSEISPSSYEGRFVKYGRDKELDELRNIKENARGMLKKLQEDEIKRTSINSLKIGYNKVFGYYIEIRKTNLAKVPQDYIRKQTLVNAERFITPELKDFEQKILEAEYKIIEIENRIIEEVKEEILKNSRYIYDISKSIAVIDTLCSLSYRAEENNYIKPEIDKGLKIFIKKGRHPVVEKLTEDFFVPNDIELDNKDNHFLIITGPNMAGKSTYIRQAATIVIMAQAGSFIPAEAAKIGLVDKIFTRIGAHDDISKGQSTFMVEMTETANILNNLSERSLLVLDEIGRGTSTYDGFSLAWAVAEHIVGTRARTLFATHFHELTGLADKTRGVKNYNVAVSDTSEGVTFLHKIEPGGADKSYGIHVAQLAGIPPEVIRRSKKILEKLEMQGALQEKVIGTMKNDIRSLFDRPETPPYIEIKNEIENFKKIKKDIMSLDIDNMTPLEVSLKMKKIQEGLKNGQD